MAPYAPNNASFSFLLFLCLLVSFMVSSNALSFKLIHRDSVHSPLYPGRNLSDTEILKRGIEISLDRMSYLESMMISKGTNESIHPDAIVPPIKKHGSMYMVEMSFGTPAKTQYLVMDTGSHVTWMQCEPCPKCYPQAYPKFDPTKSSTYKKLPCNSPFCRGFGFSCSGNDCVYQFTYGTPCTTKGVLSSETITASSSSRSVETLPNFAFGCSHENIGFPYLDSNLLGGILGLGYGPTSMLSQLGTGARGRFSYCLPGVGSTRDSYLRFGSDAIINGHYQATPLMRYSEQPTFSLYLNDISIGKQRMGFPQDLFARNRDGSGGTIIDSGSALSWLHPTAYKKIEDFLVRHFAKYNLQRYRGNTNGLSLCYVYKEHMKDYPSMTYHLKDADLVIPPENVFYIARTEGYFCYATYPAKINSIVGAWQQHNMRFVYDAANSNLMFAPEDCSKNP